MSAFFKATAVLSGLALASAGAVYTARNPSTDFSRLALATSEYSESNGGSISRATPNLVKKLPSTFFEFTRGEFKVSNHRA